MPVQPAVDALRPAGLRFDRPTEIVAPLLEAIRDARLVLVGEASHGTHEFYRMRADLTAALLEQRSFDIVAVEADWPDAYRAGRWARLQSDDAAARRRVRAPRRTVDTHMMETLEALMEWTRRRGGAARGCPSSSMP